MILSELVHPQLLLLMGHTARLELVFEPVVLGPLYTCIHTHGIQFSLEDVVLQVKLLHCRLLVIFLYLQ